ncbi:DUF4123 domain-containing protein [Chromohalobacter sp. 11-W]|uniref:DUF4123 domain-containing protein n=1 Tax=Chromohalobacter sp. 11-W TaxID=2994061 RepID=UPI0024699499|nr:DUF4123 domain-containing protein [Chromohalobacter sp. 11-W]
MTSWLLHDHLNGPLECEGVEFVGALRPRRRPDLHALTPHLYRVNESAISHVRERAEAMSRHGMPPALCALLRADVDPVVLQEQLSRFCLAATPTTRWMYCRFFDPRVMAHLRWILMPEQRQSLLGKIRCWELLNSSRHWISISNQAPEAGSVLRLSLDEDQLRHLEALPTIRECLTQWRDQDPQAPMDDAEAGRHIAERLTHARQRGLQDERDRLALVLHELLVHPDILQHPDVAHAVVMAKEGTSYRAVTSNWPQARWESIQEQLTNRETT